VQTVLNDLSEKSDRLKHAVRRWGELEELKQELETRR
jgi:hypothetical protein